MAAPRMYVPSNATLQEVKTHQSLEWAHCGVATVNEGKVVGYLGHPRDWLNDLKFQLASYLL